MPEIPTPTPQMESNARPLVWLVGARGMLGQEVAAALTSRAVPHVTTDLECDITQADSVRSFAAAHRPRVFINCAAYTAVDRAEDEEDKAFAINATGPKNLGLVASETGATLVHLSTDYVFGGMKTTPYVEDDPLAPQGAYARSKAAGEAAVHETCPRTFVIRTAWLYGTKGPNFVETMLRLFASREEVSVVDDQHGTPSYAPDLAAALATIAMATTEAFGTYHYTNSGETTWFGFARRIHDRARALGLLSRDCRLRPIATAEFPTRARRPAWSVLDKTKIVRTFGLSLRPWEEALDDYLANRRG